MTFCMNVYLETPRGSSAEPLVGLEGEGPLKLKGVWLLDAQRCGKYMHFPHFVSTL